MKASRKMAAWMCLLASTFAGWLALCSMPSLYAIGIVTPENHGYYGTPTGGDLVGITSLSIFALLAGCGGVALWSTWLLRAAFLVNAAAGILGSVFAAVGVFRS